LNDLEFHRVMGHISLTKARDMVRGGKVAGIKLVDGCTRDKCDVCVRAKITRAPIPDVADGQGAKDLGIEVKAYGDRLNADTW
ncbi:uncharacterized protein BXZ73DRAFT_23160, partial [Epithele typhae]|uniref:uncharacterized protein n=1 Tax=Epithele typhae TaxID=378194 RepID=UPI002008A8BE